MRVNCPGCGADITANEFEQDSRVVGRKDLGYECEDCRLDVYTYKVESMDDGSESE